MEIHREALESFFTQGGMRFLLIPENMKISMVMPSRMQKIKFLVITKTVSEINENNFHSGIFLTELGGQTSFEHLELMSKSILLPVLSNRQNQLKWGEVATREITDRFHSFLSSTTILCGQIKGETRLPMPPLDGEYGVVTACKNRIALLEGAIITWTRQIKNILKQDPESRLKLGFHPTPDVEIEFWKNKSSNLNSIFEQLQGNRIRRVLRALDQAKSTYCTTFARLCREVFVARIEANDNVKFLHTLEDWFNKLNTSGDFPNLTSLFKPMLHVLFLVWKHSEHYNTPARLVVLMREICNSLIEQACQYVSGEQIFQLIENEEASVAVNRLRTTLLVCGKFKSVYFEYKANTLTECPENPWRIQNNALFVRLDSFLERCHDTLDLTQTIIQFSKLSKIEIGGTKGKTLTSSIQQIHLDFQTAIDAFKNLEYDLMDVSANQFGDDFCEFQQAVKEIERRLGAVVCLALDDCSTLYTTFQLLDSFDGGLLDRSILQDELESKYVDLVHAYGQDLKLVQEVFLNHRDEPPRDTALNLPPIAGALVWCRGLLSRVQIPMTKLSELDRKVLDREEAKEVSKIQSAIVASLNEFETIKIEEWGRDVEISSDAKLKLPLLRRSESTRELTTNFDPSLIRLLREVKYFLHLELAVPESALHIFKSAEVFRSWIGNLDLIVNMNNSVFHQLLPVEKPLVAPYLAKFDCVVEKGICFLNWRSDGIEAFIGESMKQVTVVHNILKTMKDNFAAIEDILHSWDTPLLERKAKPVEKEEFERAAQLIKTSKYSSIKDTGKKIHYLLKDTNKVLRVSNASTSWRGYLEFVNSIVIDGLSSCVITSLEYLLQQINYESIIQNGKMPLIEIKLDLENGSHIEFCPPLGQSQKRNGLSDLIDSIVGTFLHVSTLFKRLDSEGKYLREMHTDVRISGFLSLISDSMDQNIAKCLELQKVFDEYSYLWTTDLSKYFSDFCEDAFIKTENGSKLMDLEKFDNAIKKYVEVQKDVSKFKSPTDIGWLRINTTPAKQQLSLLATKWIDMFTTHMLNTVTATMLLQHEFMNSVNKRLDTEVLEGPENKDALMTVMAVIRDVRKKKDPITEIFGPQRDCLAILKNHGVDVFGSTIAGQNLQDFIEEVPLVWEAVVKKTFKKKEDILPMQMASVDSLKVDLEKFYISIREFRGEFRSNAPFKFEGECVDAYANMDLYATKLDDLEIQVLKFRELEELFELQETNYPEILETRNEIKLLKNLWDFKALIHMTYSDWRTSLWKDVNTEYLEDQNKKLRRQLKDRGNTNQSMKGWKVYRDIDESISIMSIVLPLVNDLHSDAMRSRHWAALARVCNVKIVDPSDEKFVLDDMMTLKLHEHKEEIEEIVETAMKELKIERKLKEIENVWGEMMLEYIPHKETEMFVPRPSEEVVEGMEAHQMELQAIYGMGKFMEYFKERVLHWQVLLRTVDDTLRMWMTVTKAWASLESIFLASADIRAQLPDDTKRFEGIDSEFKELMKEAVIETNCVRVCSVEGRCNALIGMRQRLEMCQKSLNEYLDIKKKIFPRFYFVSSVALLDMLANGTNPPKIMPYLGDCYDALADLDFIELEDTTKSDKITDTMIAKDGEKVPLAEHFAMEGEVESYLNRLTEAMQNSLKLLLSDAIEKAANWEIELPRHEWLFNYPAQLCITGTQIYWTDETQLALEEYEGGQEDSVKRYLQICNSRLQALIQLVLGDLIPADRTKIISLITMDVHSRDVVDRLVTQKTEGPSAFAWQQQLRFEWEQPSNDVDVKICDFSCKYFYEWVGNTGRLVITPLTDRCYITLTMGLKLFLGGAPAGPAGTGKVSIFSFCIYYFHCTN